MQRAVLVGGQLPELLGLPAQAIESRSIAAQPKYAHNAALLSRVRAEGRRALGGHAGQIGHQVDQDRRERHLANHPVGGRGIDHGITRSQSQLLQGRVREELANGNHQACLAGPRRDLDASERISSQREEVVFTSHAGDP
jgi:hypothetical protein